MIADKCSTAATDRSNGSHAFTRLEDIILNSMCEENESSSVSSCELAGVVSAFYVHDHGCIPFRGSHLSGSGAEKSFLGEFARKNVFLRANKAHGLCRGNI